MVKITRRTLLSTSAKLIAAGTFITAMPTKLIAETLEMAVDDYEVAIGLAKQMIAYSAEFYAERNSLRRPDVMQVAKDRVTATFDILAPFLVDKFPLTNDPGEIAAIHALWDERGAASKCWESNPRVLFGPVFAVAIVRELVSVHRAPINTQLAGFNAFSGHYLPVFQSFSAAPWKS